MQMGRGLSPPWCRGPGRPQGSPLPPMHPVAPPAGPTPHLVTPHQMGYNGSRRQAGASLQPVRCMPHRRSRSWLAIALLLLLAAGPFAAPPILASPPVPTIASLPANLEPALLKAALESRDGGLQCAASEAWPRTQPRRSTEPAKENEC